MASFGANYNPSAVMMGRPANGGNPYMPIGPNDGAGGGNKPMPIFPKFPGLGGATRGGPGGPLPVGGPASFGTPVSGANVLGPESIRATGTGPFDPAYRQNLATYAGGQFARGGGLSFNPTDISSFPGQPTGGGTAPVTGMPSTLMDMALAGQGFSWTPPQPAQTATQPPRYTDMRAWMDQFMRNGRGGRMGSIL